MKKTGVIGAGAVGSQLAFLLALSGVCDEVALVDIKEGLAEGKALDMSQAAPVTGSRCRVSGSEDFSLIEGSDITVMTAGAARRPGMSREDLLNTNLGVVREVSALVKKYAPGTLLIMVTNPLDIMAFAAYVFTGFEPSRVMGMSGVLDTSRYRSFLAAEAGVAPPDTRAMILGPHGDSMVILPEADLGGESADTLIETEVLEGVKTRARSGGKEIVELLRDSSAFFAPAASAACMVKAIAGDTGEVLPCSVYAAGVLDLPEVFIGLPVRLGREGIREVVTPDLAPAELKALKDSAADLEKKIISLELK